MQEERSSPAWRVALFVVIAAATVWLGASHARSLVGADLLVAGTTEVRRDIAPDAERQTYRVISIISVASMAGYTLTLAAAVMFVVYCPFRLKDHGWLMVSIILFAVCIPVEAFSIYHDIQMVYHEFSLPADNDAFRGLLSARIAALSGVPFIATLCYYTIIGLAVFQPMKRARPGPS